jgi:hypothetical protein
MVDALERQLLSSLEFFASGNSFGSAVIGEADEVEEQLKKFGSRIEEDEYARVAWWTPEQRRGLLAELHSMRQVLFLMEGLNGSLAEIPNPMVQHVGRLG